MSGIFQCSISGPTPMALKGTFPALSLTDQPRVCLCVPQLALVVQLRETLRKRFSSGVSVSGAKFPRGQTTCHSTLPLLSCSTSSLKLRSVLFPSGSCLTPQIRLQQAAPSTEGLPHVVRMATATHDLLQVAASCASRHRCCGPAFCGASVH